MDRLHLPGLVIIEPFFKNPVVRVLARGSGHYGQADLGVSHRIVATALEYNRVAAGSLEPLG